MALEFSGQPSGTRYYLSILAAYLIVPAAQTAFRSRPFNEVFGLVDQFLPDEIIIFHFEMKARIFAVVPGIVAIKLAA